MPSGIQPQAVKLPWDGSNGEGRGVLQSRDLTLEALLYLCHIMPWDNIILLIIIIIIIDVIINVIIIIVILLISIIIITLYYYYTLIIVLVCCLHQKHKNKMLPFCTPPSVLA